ncbi:MFS transporter [Streptomyces sp. LX-29]|uniref:MFS transporter n=1 Tax=Streptomyces sp. LX-29 TaxID=2900152 RepID=UPI00240E6EB4|nr:MFS transporter [Streptomyces sp. LX-29]WFB05856.1 MFS transporter [Streptomyces sp. LX-29]
MTGAARPHLALLVSVAGAVIVALDGTVLLVAQPSLQRDLGATVAQVQWTSTGYLLAVAAFLVVAGRLGDRYGHLRLLFVGVLGFGAASAGIALAPHIGWVIGLRAVQGVFGALLQPATLALLRLSYPPHRLSTPVALRTSAIAVAAGAGPVLGGVLVEQLGWRAVFWVNLPLALVIAALALAVRAPMPERVGTQRPDLAGATLLVSSLAVLVHTLAEVPSRGWAAPPTLLGLVAVVGLAAALVAHERRAAQPIVPAAVARSTSVTASMVLLLVTGGGMFGALFLANFLLQDLLRLDPLASGLRVLPLTALMVLGAPAASAALRRYGPRRTAIAGTLLVTLGIAGLSRLDQTSTWAVTGVTFAVLGAGFATVMVTATGTVVGDAPPEYAGVVGGLKQTAMNIGPTLGIAVAASMMHGTPAAVGPLTTSAPPLEPALLALAGLSALGLLPASLLPPGPAAGRTRDTTASADPGPHPVGPRERTGGS